MSIEKQELWLRTVLSLVILAYVPLGYVGGEWGVAGAVLIGGRLVSEFARAFAQVRQQGRLRAEGNDD